MGNIIKRIVLTGGPSSGKSSSLKTIKDYFVNQGYLVYIVNESATELINSGLIPGDYSITNEYFQEIILKYQLYKEELINSIAKSNNSEKSIIILYDRGLLDGKAYIKSYEFQEILKKLNLKELDLLNRYDLVIHLETGAKSKFYRTDNNSARMESKEEAIIKDNETFDAWKAHKNINRVKCYENFQNKQNQIISICKNSLENNIRKQYKYTIDNNKFIFNPDWNDKCDIEQYYLNFNDELEHRVRKTIAGDNVNYRYTIQKKLDDGLSQIIYDSNIDSKYYSYLTNNNSVINKVHKTRYYIIFEDVILYLDLFDDGRVILESNEDSFNYDKFKVLKNITGNPLYNNINIMNKEKVLKKI